MQINTDKLCKRYSYQWIIRDFSYTFSSGQMYAIAGANGSGKSTLIKLISGYLTPSSGHISFESQNKNISVDSIYKYITLAAPYTDLINEFNLEEIFTFHTRFKTFRDPMCFSEFEEIIQLKNQSYKQIRFYSSGMKQKVQLALSVLSDSSLLLLDEPTSYLDENARKWFSQLLENNKTGKTILIASNDSFDIDLCSEIISL